MMTNRQRMLMAVKGEMPDRLPFAPRLDLWYNANAAAGTLPAKHRGRTADEIARAEGWALHKVNPEYQKTRRPEENLHWALGILALKECVFDYRFGGEIDIAVEGDGQRTTLVYRTPRGAIRTTVVYTEEMKRAGASNYWIAEHAIKDVRDYAALSYIFEHVELVPRFADFNDWQDSVGEDGLAVALAGRAASPMHHIQKYFLDPTDFYYHYHDHPKEMRALAESLETFFEQALASAADSPAKAIYWGANFDDMITYPRFFAREILPWIRKAAHRLESTGKYLFCHCDGENQGLLDLIRDSNMHVAEAVCPHPMTKVKIEEYYQRWGDKLTIFGGIPSILLLEESATGEEFQAYMAHLFEAVAPGTRMILGIADSIPPNAVFERIVRIGDMVEKHGRLPLAGGGGPRPAPIRLSATSEQTATRPAVDKRFSIIQEDVLQGRHEEIKQHVQEMLGQGAKPGEILQRGMLSAMAVIGGRFKAGTVFIPEVLLSARAMNEALAVLEPYLVDETGSGGGKVLIATVQGDLHDIGKNLVASMLRGAGLEVRDLGINVRTADLVRQVEEYKPRVLALSALLTTTMPEMKRVIDALADRGLGSDVKVIIGGAPVNEKFARDIGADGYGADAAEAVTLVRRLLEAEP
jgi:methylmalonyl-CoA mutase cobalamin-binding domain/chain